MKRLLSAITAISQASDPAGDIQTELVGIVGKGFRKIRPAYGRTRSGQSGAVSLMEKNGYAHDCEVNVQEHAFALSPS